MPIFQISHFPGPEIEKIENNSLTSFSLNFSFEHYKSDEKIMSNQNRSKFDFFPFFKE